MYIHYHPSPFPALLNFQNRQLFISTAPLHLTSLYTLIMIDVPLYRGYSQLRTRTAPKKVLCSWALTYCRVLRRCVSLISCNPCTPSLLPGLPCEDLPHS